MTYDQDWIEDTLRYVNSVPKGEGPITKVVARVGNKQHVFLSEGRLTREEGLIGDRWSLEGDPERKRQLSLVNYRLIEMIRPDGDWAAGQYILPGDNLMVEMDLSEKYLPADAILRVGKALIQLTGEPHLPCKRFSKRFGVDATKFVTNKAHAHLRLRGVMARVLEDGIVRPQDQIKLVSA